MKLVLAGAGHAHLESLLHLEDFRKAGAQVRVISAGDLHYYSGMGPGLLSGRYTREQCCFDVRSMVEQQGGVFVSDRVLAIDPHRRILRLESGGEESYDLLSVNLGSAVVLTPALRCDENSFAVKPIEQLLRARHRAIELIRGSTPPVFTVAGGGAAAVELACALWQIAQDQRRPVRICLRSRHELLGQAPARVRQLVRQSLKARQIDVQENDGVLVRESNAVVLESGRRHRSDLTLYATGVRPPALFSEARLQTGASGGLLVDAHLRSLGHGEIFGGGDCVDHACGSLDKVGVYAVRQNPVLRHNLLASLKGTALRTFDPQSAYMLILNMGGGRAIAWKGERVYEGRLAFRFKDFIDRRFMKRYQGSG